MALMSSRRGLSKQELFDEIELYRSVESQQAREKLFDRDKAALREQGIPVQTLPGDALFENESASQRYRINVREYRIPDLNFSVPELAVLALAARMWEDAAFGTAAQRALRKVSLKSGGMEDVELPLLQPRLSTEDPFFHELWHATAQRQRVRFDYIPSGARTAQARTVQPWGMGSRFGHWYLVGFDEDREAERYFRLSRISGNVHTIPGTYNVPADFSIHRSLASLSTSMEQRQARLLVQQGAAHAIRLEGRVMVGQDGTDTVVVPFTDVMAMSAQLAGLGAKVEVLEPAELRDAVHERISAALVRALEPVPDLVCDSVSPVATVPGRGSTSEDHLARLLDLVPYVMHHQGADLADTAEHFGVTPARLVKDLNLLFVSGPRHYPDHLMDISYEGNRIFIDNAEKLSEPVRLAMDEAYALIAGLECLKSLPGMHQGGAVDSALKKLVGAAGAGGYSDGVLGGTIAERGLVDRLEELKGALETRKQVRLTYLVPGRDEITRRDVDPLRLFSHNNDWYLEAWCRSVDGLRNFRLDRIVEAGVLDLPVRERTQQRQQGHGAAGALFTPGNDDVAVTLLIADRAESVVERYQAQQKVSLSDGRLAAVIEVGDTAWLPGFVASHGGDIAIAAPQSLRGQVIEWLQDALHAWKD